MQLFALFYFRTSTARRDLLGQYSTWTEFPVLCKMALQLGGVWIDGLHCRIYPASHNLSAGNNPYPLPPSQFQQTGDWDLRKKQKSKTPKTSRIRNAILSSTAQLLGSGRGRISVPEMGSLFSGVAGTAC